MAMSRGEKKSSQGESRLAEATLVKGIIKGVAKDVPIGTIFRGIMPFLAADIFEVILLLFIPQIALFLPSFMSY
jgi:TRAP-type mannitol/chloroaromatic compound transport system permease large subunit